MDSSMMPQNYGNSNEVLYGAHYATLVSPKVSYENRQGQFVLNYITPNMETESSYEKTLPKNSVSNVINKDNLGISKITTSNYITLEIPEYLFNITDLQIVTNRQNHTCGHCGFNATYTCNPKIIVKRKEFLKGTQFIVVNVGGDVDVPHIIGVK